MFAVDIKDNDNAVNALKQLISLKIKAGAMRLRKPHQIKVAKRELHNLRQSKEVR